MPRSGRYPWPVTRLEDHEVPSKGKNQRLVRIGFTPKDYVRLLAYCKTRRCPVGTMVRMIVLSYLDRMEARKEGP